MSLRIGFLNEVSKERSLYGKSQRPRYQSGIISPADIEIYLSRMDVSLDLI